MKRRQQDLEASLQGELATVWLVAGDEPLLVNEACDAIRAAARRDGYETRDLFVAERSFDWGRLTEAGQSMSLFSERRILDLRLPTGKPGERGGKTLAALAGDMPADTLLLVSAPKIERRATASKWYKALDANGVIVDIWPMEARALPGWIERRARDAGLHLDRESVLHLARRTEGNLLAAQQEIDKLGLLSVGERVTPEDVEAAVADSARYTIFKLADEAMAGRSERALRMLGGLRREGVAATLVLWALGKELRQLASMSERIDGGDPVSQVLSSYRVWSSRQPLVRAALARLGLDDLHALVRLAERADRASKGQSREEPWSLLARITAGLASGRVIGTAA